jgi:hypothetical protein
VSSHHPDTLPGAVSKRAGTDPPLNRFI